MSSHVHPDLAEILVTAFQVPTEEIRPTATLEELGLDSLAVIELADILAERLAVQVAEGELAAGSSLAAVSELLGDRTGAR
ncbi:acyl carrier protein [Kitasatospora sp. NPDC008050]|uniref:acyl carrier protein n=1 Tax=Kitasatospora sp. NPDC008050 TaxID=3364021 RepID=UPI0036E258B5